jgi:nucleotide-binding universal stress UspA family protein
MSAAVRQARPESSHLYREIHEQPAVPARLLKAGRPAAEALAAEIRRRGIDLVLIAARYANSSSLRSGSSSREW